jgi:hypothetical protein
VLVALKYNVEEYFQKKQFSFQPLNTTNHHMSTPNTTNAIKTDRHLRLWSQQYAQDESKKDNILKWQDGALTRPLYDEQGSVQTIPAVTIAGQKLTIDFSNKYPDDAIALLRDMYVALNLQHPNEYNSRIIDFLNQAIFEADRRAVARHGYAGNVEEQ